MKFYYSQSLRIQAQGVPENRKVKTITSTGTKAKRSSLQKHPQTIKKI